MQGNRSKPPGWIGHVTFTYKDVVYLWGGYKETSDVETVYFPPFELIGYWIKWNRWFTFRCTGKSPDSTTGSTAAIVGDHVYLFGGYSQNPRLSWLNHLYRFCLDSFVWEYLTPSGPTPYPVDKTVSWSYDGKFYIFGGFGNVMVKTELNTKFNLFECVFENDAGRAWINQFLEYDPKTNRWSIPIFKGPLPLARAAHAAAVAQNKVFIFGGRRLNRRMNDLHCFDLSSMTWSGAISIDGPLPEGRSWHSLTALSSNLLFLYGGFSNTNEVLSDAWLFIIDSMTWKRVKLPCEKPRLWHTASLLPNGLIMVDGGCESNIFTVTHKKEAETIFLNLSPKPLLSLCYDLIFEDKRLSHLRNDVKRMLSLLGIEKYMYSSESGD